MTRSSSDVDFHEAGKSHTLEKENDHGIGELAPSTVGVGRSSFPLKRTLNLAIDDFGSRKKVIVASLSTCSIDMVQNKEATMLPSKKGNGYR